MAGVQTEREGNAGLTTTKAPFIEQAQAEGRLYIHQPYELYSEDNHDAWRRLFARHARPLAPLRQRRASCRASTTSASTRTACRGWRTSTDFSARSPASGRSR